MVAVRFPPFSSEFSTDVSILLSIAYSAVSGWLKFCLKSRMIGISNSLWHSGRTFGCYKSALRQA